MPALAVPAAFRDARGPAAHDSACHFAEEKRVVPPEETLPEPPRVPDRENGDGPG